MMGKKIAYLDRNEYNYGPAPEIENRVLCYLQSYAIKFLRRVHRAITKKIVLMQRWLIHTSINQ